MAENRSGTHSKRHKRQRANRQRVENPDSDSDSLSESDFGFQSKSDLATGCRSKKTIDSALRALLKMANQRQAWNFIKIFGINFARNLEKVDSGSFCEVFVCREEKLVLKVLPICEDSSLRGGFTKVSEATRHLTAARLVSTLDDLGGSGFCTSTFEKMNRVYIVQGSPPIYLERGWYRYLWRCGHCDIMYPYSRLSSEQLWFVMECELCGIPIHRVLLPCAQARLSVFAQVALALAVGERRLQLEHRDLNCGNILLQTVGKWEDCCSQVPPTSCLEGRVYQPCRGPTAKIVDFTFARLQHGNSTVFYDLSIPPEEFVRNDPRIAVFRKMKEETKGKWSLYRPRTNVFWLEFLARVYLVQHLRDSRIWRGIKVKACPIHCGSYDDGVSTRTLRERQEEILALLKKSGSAMDFVALAQKRAPYLFQIERPQEKRSGSSDGT